ncbi:MAG: biopolymer transporter ExbD [Planctomycetota bacterium]
MRIVVLSELFQPEVVADRRSDVVRFVKDEPNPAVDQQLQMSSMIDIVFLLLVFFVMTFRITAQEGDFAMDGAAVVGTGHAAIATNLPLRLKLDAEPNGELMAMSLNGERVAGFEDLQARLIGLETDGALRDVVLTLDCDSNLKYANVIAVLDHVTQYRDAAGERKALVGSTRFAVRR